MKQLRFSDSVSLLEFGVVSAKVAEFSATGALEHLTYALNSNPEINDRVINLPLGVSLAGGAVLTTYFAIEGIRQGGIGLAKYVQRKFSGY